MICKMVTQIFGIGYACCSTYYCKTGWFSIPSGQLGRLSLSLMLSMAHQIMERFARLGIQTFSYCAGANDRRLSDTSEDSFVSATGDFVPYDESRKVGNEEEASQHAMQVAEEEEEEQMLLSRFSGEVDVREWCVGSHCETFF